MNIVHLIVVKNSFYILESGRTIQKTSHFSLILRTKNLVKFGTQQLRGVAQNDTSTLHGVVHSTNYTFHSMVWPISSWKHGLGWFVIGNSSNIHKTNCQLRFHCYATIISKFTDSPIQILSWLFSYVPSSNINFCHLQMWTSEFSKVGYYYTISETRPQAL